MKPGPYFFLLGLVIGGAAVGTFSWYRGSQIIDERVSDEVTEKARDCASVERDASECRSTLEYCQAANRSQLGR